MAVRSLLQSSRFHCSLTPAFANLDSGKSSTHFVRFPAEKKEETKKTVKIQVASKSRQDDVTVEERSCKGPPSKSTEAAAVLCRLERQEENIDHDPFLLSRPKLTTCMATCFSCVRAFNYINGEWYQTLPSETRMCIWIVVNISHKHRYCNKIVCSSLLSTSITTECTHSKVYLLPYDCYRMWNMLHRALPIMSSFLLIWRSPALKREEKSTNQKSSQSSDPLDHPWQLPEK